MRTTDTITRQWVEWEDRCEQYRIMTPAEIEERGNLNIANTASAQRARVIAEQSKGNGHSISEPLFRQIMND
jgi:hypothetical protein